MAVDRIAQLLQVGNASVKKVDVHLVSAYLPNAAMVFTSLSYPNSAMMET